ncbi:hypothetical protein N9L68_02505 [bacterium]|nr:hypothetical protein [bacterium]
MIDGPNGCSLPGHSPGGTAPECRHQRGVSSPTSARPAMCGYNAWAASPCVGRLVSGMHVASAVCGYKFDDYHIGQGSRT